MVKHFMTANPRVKSLSKTISLNNYTQRELLGQFQPPPAPPVRCMAARIFTKFTTNYSHEVEAGSYRQIVKENTL